MLNRIFAKFRRKRYAIPIIPPKSGRMYKHYKGGKYRVIMCAINEADGRTMVVYKGVSSSEVYVRPLSEFVVKFEECNGR